MEYSKTCYGTTCLDTQEFPEEDVNYRIELEYYKTRNIRYNILGKKINEYGIEILKKEFRDNDFNVETNLIENISKNKGKVIEIINILRRNKVTPIELKEVIADLLN